MAKFRLRDILAKARKRIFNPPPETMRNLPRPSVSPVPNGPETTIERAHPNGIFTRFRSLIQQLCSSESRTPPPAPVENPTRRIVTRHGLVDVPLFRLQDGVQLLVAALQRFGIQLGPEDVQKILEIQDPKILGEAYELYRVMSSQIVSAGPVRGASLSEKRRRARSNADFILRILNAADCRNNENLQFTLEQLDASFAGGIKRTPDTLRPMSRAEASAAADVSEAHIGIEGGPCNGPPLTPAEIRYAAVRRDENVARELELRLRRQQQSA